MTSEQLVTALNNLEEDVESLRKAIDELRYRIEGKDGWKLPSPEEARVASEGGYRDTTPIEEPMTPEEFVDEHPPSDVTVADGNGGTETVTERVLRKLAEHGVAFNSCLEITQRNGAVRIVADFPETKIEEQQQWQDWTNTRFGKGKPGDIEWGTYTREDGSEGYYPEAFVIPLHALPEVLG